MKLACAWPRLGGALEQSMKVWGTSESMLISSDSDSDEVLYHACGETNRTRNGDPAGDDAGLEAGDEDGVGSVAREKSGDREGDPLADDSASGVRRSGARRSG